jgi:hypothetical protein
MTMAELYSHSVPLEVLMANLSAIPVEEHRCDFSEDYPVMGFLQLCADRRFHACLQKRFQEDAKLESPLHYWIHADAGGTPAMADLVTAPDYCYHDKEVRLMGWSAHGDGCGGFPDLDDDEIRELLMEVAEARIADYPEADHFVYFATMKHDKGAEAAVVYCQKRGKTVG